jgi:hypothetical protein
MPEIAPNRTKSYQNNNKNFPLNQKHRAAPNKRRYGSYYNSADFVCLPAPPVCG